MVNILCIIMNFVVSSHSLSPLFFFTMAGENLQQHAFAKNIKCLNQQASSVSSQPQISQNCNDFLQCICNPSAVWCRVCCPVSIGPWSYPILKTSLLFFCGFHLISYQVAWASALVDPLLRSTGAKSVAKYFIFRENVKVIPKHTEGNVYFLHYYEWHSRKVFHHYFYQRDSYKPPLFK